MIKISDALKNAKLFEGITQTEVNSLIGCLGGTLRTFEKGEIIYHSGDVAREIGVVCAGRVHIFKEDIWGNSNIIAEAAEGDMFAEAVVCSGAGVMPVSVVAIVPSKVLFINFQRIVTTCSSSCIFHTALIRNMIAIIAQKNMVLSAKMEHITKRTTKDKLLSYLSEQARLHNSNVFEIPFNRQELADYLSVERSALSAQMSKLSAEGVIAYRKNRFKILAPIEQ